MDLSMGQLFLTALNSSAPVLIIIAIGALFNLTNIVSGKNFRQLNNITFKFSITISAIYTIGKQNLATNDLKIILSLIIVTLIGFTINIPLAFLYKNSERFYAYAYISSTTVLTNSVFSGLPVFSGIYGYEITARYAYLQMLVCLGFALFFIYLQFEIAIVKGKVISSVQQGISCDVVTEKKFIFKNRNVFVICLLKTVKQPLLIAILISVIYNTVGIKLSLLKNLPIYLSQFFNNFSVISAPLGLLSIGMFASDLVKQKEKKTIETGLMRQIICFIFVCIQRSFLLPLILVLIEKLLNIEYLTAEINASVYTSPEATLSYAICDIGISRLSIKQKSNKILQDGTSLCDVRRNETISSIFGCIFSHELLYLINTLRT